MDYRTDPDKIFSENDEENEIIDKIKYKFSKNELSIFELKIKGLSNKEIANLLDKDSKFIENTMFRINKKYKSMFKE